MALPKRIHRFSEVDKQKAGGITYTPPRLADFVASQIVETADFRNARSSLRVLDPAVGEGELLVSLMQKLREKWSGAVEVHGYDTDATALARAEKRLLREFPGLEATFRHGNFLDVITETAAVANGPTLFAENEFEYADLLIANPPYIRTQVLGAAKAQDIARTFGLSGRVDVYHAFILAMGAALKPGGTAGIIVSNRFMSTKSGETIRRTLRGQFSLIHAWDFGDTKLFDAAVLPAVLLFRNDKPSNQDKPKFTSIYETEEPALSTAACPVEAVGQQGIVEVEDGRRFRVVHGALKLSETRGEVWRVATDAGDSWLETVHRHRWGKFRDIGKIRVGVKTCADKVFIRDDWQSLGEDVPELLRPLTTHHIGRRFKASDPRRTRSILYPHEVVAGTRKAVDISKYPATHRYLESHRSTLEGRSYVLQAGRQWYEIWVPQDPAAWAKPKLVFRDISEEPTFWLDLAGTVVNGDCYWLINESRESDDMLWLGAAVANSTFIESYYDHRFNNKLYAGRRRFITQYVEEFPLPDPVSKVGKEIVARAKRIYTDVGTPDSERESQELEKMVWAAFGLTREEVGR